MSDCSTSERAEINKTTKLLRPHKTTWPSRQFHLRTPALTPRELFRRTLQRELPRYIFNSFYIIIPPAQPHQSPYLVPCKSPSFHGQNDTSFSLKIVSMPALRKKKNKVDNLHKRESIFQFLSMEKNSLHPVSQNQFSMLSNVSEDFAIIFFNSGVLTL